MARPIPFTSRSKLKHEAVVTFSTVEVRDIVRRAAKELAGSPEVGIRLEIPQFLQPSLKPLEAVSYSLKKKFPNTRRNIKFDDGRLDLVLDFCTDPSDVDQPWRKVRPDQAAAFSTKTGGRQNAEEMSEEQLGDLFGKTEGALKLITQLMTTLQLMYI